MFCIKCVRLWVKYQYLCYPISCWILITATCFTIYDMAAKRPNVVKKPTETKSMVLIMAYMRSGSSLVGDILQQHESSFYVFEPLRSIEETSDRNLSVEFYNGTKRYLRTPQERSEAYVENLYNWFTCNFKQLDLGTLTSSYLLHYSISTRTYSTCLTRHNYSLSGIGDCVKHLRATCIPAKLKIIKSIRIDMGTVHLLLKRLPQLKVVHLLRDPRGIMQSRVRTKLTTWLNLDVKVKQLCDRITNNLDVASQIRKEFLGRLKTLRYERLAESPVPLSEELYNFVDMKLSLKATKKIHRMTKRPSSARDCDWCTKKANSTKTSLAWRKQINLSHTSIIDEICVDMYLKAGYKKITDEQNLRNLGISLWQRDVLPIEAV